MGKSLEKQSKELATSHQQQIILTRKPREIYFQNLMQSMSIVSKSDLYVQPI